MEKEIDVFKHFLIDEGSIEKLIEIWTFFNPNDTPYPLTKNTVCLNNKYNDITGEQLLHYLKFKVFENLYWLDRFHVKCFTLKMEKPIDFIYNHFVTKVKSPEDTPKKSTFEGIENVEEKPKKERKSKPKTK